jgi:hypothetical protein
MFVIEFIAGPAERILEWGEGGLVINRPPGKFLIFYNSLRLLPAF